MSGRPDLVSWRQEADERLRQDAFLAEIARHWQPATPAERRLALRARLVHAWVRAFGGSASLAPAAAAGVLAAVGTVLLPAARAPHNPEYTLGPPPWAYLLITLGLIGMAVEAFRSPRRIRPVRYALTAALPLAVGAAVVGLMLHIATTADQVLRVGVPAFGVGVLVVSGLAAAGRWRAVRIALRLTSLAFAATGAGQLDWAWMYGDSGYSLLAVASACTAGGAVLIALGLARVDLLPPVTEG